MPVEPKGVIGLAVAAGVFGLAGVSKTWKESRLAQSPRAAEEAAGRLPFKLVESSAAAGLVNVHQKAQFSDAIKNVAPMLAAVGGASVAVADFDGDGYMDVYLTNTAKGSKNRLFRNNHDGTFTDVAEKAGVADVNKDGGSLSALFFDYDNDGKKDLLVLTFGCAKLFHNEGGGRFKEVKDAGGITHCGFAYAVAAVDYDGDGYPDLIIADYYKPLDYLGKPESTRFMQNSQVQADNGGPVAVFHNNRNGTFSEVPGALGLAGRGWVHAIGAYDLRGTGRRDLYVASDFGSDRLFLNEGGGKFTDASAAVTDKHSKSAMNAETADVDNDGRPAVYVTNIYEPPYTIGENVLWKRQDDGTFKNVARERGVDRCGWAWGAKFVDLDNDGRLDLVVANGFISNNPKKSYWFTMGTLYSGGRRLVEDARNWPPIGDASISGYQRDCVFLNKGDHFENVSAASGIDSDRSDGRAVATIDARNNGSVGFIVASQGQPVRYYENKQENGNRWIGFALKGRRSGKDALGAEVRVRLKDGRVLTRQVAPNNSFLSQSDPRLHFGLGPSPAIASVDVRWPSGARQSLGAPAVGKYHEVEEPDAQAQARR